ncbi:MAG: DUF559 domain-containing protein [Nanoarchaeota archaeon]
MLCECGCGLIPTKEKRFIEGHAIILYNKNRIIIPKHLNPNYCVLKCFVCQNEFYVLKSKSLKRKFCSQQCMAINMTGKHNWRYGLSAKTDERVKRNIESRGDPWNKGLKMSEDWAWNKGLTKETSVVVRKISDANIGRNRWQYGHSSRGESYPEKSFREFLESLNFIKDEDFFQEYFVKPYFLDFAFLKAKIDIEIDGKQHLEERFLLHDKKRDLFLMQTDWIVFRITAKELYKFLKGG